MSERDELQEDGSYRWSCSIDKDFHRSKAKAGFWACLAVAGVSLLAGFFASGMSSAHNSIWMILLVPFVIMIIGLPLIFLYGSAEDPHESYVLTEKYVKSGYGREAVFATFEKTKTVAVRPQYIELSGQFRTVRVYVPAEDGEFVREYILARIPGNAVVKYH